MIQITTLTLDALVYTPIYAPRHCYKVEIINNSAVVLTLRSNPTDANTSITLLPGSKLTFESTKNTAVYDPASPLLYGILASGTGTVKVVSH